MFKKKEKQELKTVLELIILEADEDGLLQTKPRNTDVGVGNGREIEHSELAPRRRMKQIEIDLVGRLAEMMEVDLAGPEGWKTDQKLTNTKRKKTLKVLAKENAKVADW